MCDVLIRFLESMHSAVVPFDLCERFARAPDRTAFCQSVNRSAITIPIVITPLQSCLDSYGIAASAL